MSSSRSQTRVQPVAVVGAGPGDPGLLTVRAADRLAAADVVLLPRRHLGDLLQRCRPDVEVVDTEDGSDAELARLAASRAKAGQRVVRAYPGDPFVAGAGGGFAAALTRAKVAWELVPGLSTATAVPAYAGVSLLDAKHRSVAVVDLTEGPAPDWSAVSAATLVVLGGGDDLGKLAAGLTETGWAGDVPVAVTGNGTTPQQRTVVTTLDALEADVSQAGLAGPATVVVGEVVRSRDKLSWFETKPLFGWKVLVPRTKDQAGPVCAQLRSLGAVPFEVPTIAVEPPRTPAQMDRAIHGLVSGRYQWVAFTSANAVKAVREKYEELGLDARSMGGVKVAAVGEATAGALLAWGIRPELVPSGQQSSEGLLADFPDYDPVFDPLDRVFLPRADIATETLAAGLKQRGWEVDDVTAYRTVRAAPPAAEVRDAIKTGGFDAVLFTSSSTVRNLVGIAGKPHASTVIAVIGPQTEKTAQEHGLRVDVHAPRASASALVDALADFAVQRQAEHPGPPGKANRPRPAPKAKRAR